MTTYNWSTLTNGQTITTFDPNADVLIFDDGSITAANVIFNGDNSVAIPFATFFYSGKTVTLNMDPLKTTTSNVTFANGSQLLIGDNTTGTVNDDSVNALTGGTGNDQFIGLSGADSLSGGGGNDIFTMFTGLTNTWGNDTISGGAGTDTINFNTGDPAVSGLVVTFTGFDITLGALATITGGDGPPAGSTVTLSGVERVVGTNLADTFIGTTATPVNSLRTDVTLVFEGAGGNDTITGAVGDGHSTAISFRSALNGVTVSLATGTSTGGISAGNDVFTNIDGILGSDFADGLNGGSNSLNAGGSTSEFFEGFGGNDVINGGNGGDRVQYENSPSAVFVNLANGTALDGWGGFDTLISIERVRGSAFNDTLLGGAGDDQFEGLNGNDTIDGGAGVDNVYYGRADGAVYVNLATGEGRALDTVVGAGVGVDTFSHIEFAQGGDFADLLIGGGDGDLNSVSGLGRGTEWFEGRAGNDTLDGGDAVVNGSSIDIARYTNAPGAVIVNLSASTVLGVASNTANDGFGVNGNLAGIDTLININGIMGSRFGDRLEGGANDEFFEGRAGVDTINGGGGIDTLVNDSASIAVTINLATLVFNDGYGTLDVVTGIENVWGTDFNDSLTGDNNANLLYGGNGADTLVGGLGNDTLIGGDDTNNDLADYSAAAGAVTVNLATGAASGADGNDTLIGIEFVFGGASGDTLIGDEEVNFLRGNGGDDVLDGGGQSLAIAKGNLSGDFADYQNATGPVTVNLSILTAQNTGAGNDTLSNFESIRGSNNAAFGDTLTGDGGNNFFRGGLGNDTFNGGAGIDWADYANAGGSVTVTLGNDTLAGSSSGADGIDVLNSIEGASGSDFNDTLTGGTGNDWFRGRNGNDSINGGAGFDTVTYRPAGAVTVNLGTGTATGGEGTDTLVSIEAVEGSMNNDNLTGSNTADNALYGFGGNDTLRVTLGQDTLDGGDGGDIIDFTQVTGVVYGGSTAVNVNLATHVSDLNRSAAGADSILISIESVLGTAGDDIFVGGDVAHGTDSFGNNISEFFRGNGGNDTITGGAGAIFNAIADYSTNTNVQAVSANLATGIVSDGLGGTDTLTNIDVLRGGAGNDSLVGGSLSRAQNGTFQEQFRGNAGNDILNGNNASIGGGDANNDRADYSNNTNLQAVNVNLGTGIALDGLGGTDTLIDIDQVHGGAGNDILIGNANNNQLDGGAGNDTLDGGAGTDEVRFLQSNAAVIVNLSAGSITVNGVTVAAGTANDGMGGTDTLINMENVRGSDFNDYFRGSDDVNTRQLFDGDAGNDTIDGGAGIDIASYAGVSIVLGGLNAFLENGAGTVNDKKGGTDTLINIEGLAGSHSNDTLTGGLGDQWFRGNGGSDSIDGGAGNDWVFYSNSPTGVTIDLGTGTATDGWNGLAGLLALGGTDTLISIENAEGSDYNDSIIGGNGANELRGRDGDDSIFGSDGNDTLDGGNGNDTLDGGIGNDTASYTGAASSVVVNLTANTATGGAGTDTLVSIENVTGSGFNDTLIGGSGDNVLNGGNGSDTASYATAGAGVVVNLATGTASGGGGNDTLSDIENIVGSGSSDTLIGNGGDNVFDGGLGADLMFGGIGNDTFFVDGQPDIVFENVGEGADTVISTTSFYLYDNIENLTLAVGTGNTFGSANASNNTITGNEGGNLLIGWDGNDTIYGGAGNDVIYGVNNDDVLNGDAGIDVLIAGEGNDTLDGGADADEMYGENGNDVLYGGTGFVTDILVAGAGNDTLDGSASIASGQPRNQGDFDYLYGGTGDDTYYVDTPSDLTFEFNGNTDGIDTVIADINGAGFYLYDSTENLTLIGNTSFGVGNGQDNVITGNAIGTFLLGGGGNDTINGKAGNDVLFGETGADTFVFERGTGGDVIGDFQVGVDKIKLVGIGYNSFAEVSPHMIAGTTGAIDLGLGDIIVLNGVNTTSLTAGDFLFA